MNKENFLLTLARGESVSYNSLDASAKKCASSLFHKNKIEIVDGVISPTKIFNSNFSKLFSAFKRISNN